MAKQDEYVRITLRLPPDLHARLLDSAGAKSLNAEIVDRLEGSFEQDSFLRERTGDPTATIGSLAKIVSDIQEIRRYMETSANPKLNSLMTVDSEKLKAWKAEGDLLFLSPDDNVPTWESRISKLCQEISQFAPTSELSLYARAVSNALTRVQDAKRQHDRTIRTKALKQELNQLGSVLATAVTAAGRES